MFARLFNVNKGKEKKKKQYTILDSQQNRGRFLSASAPQPSHRREPVTQRTRDEPEVSCRGTRPFAAMATWRLRRAAASLAAASAIAAASAAAWPSASASDLSPAALEAARQRVAQPGAAPPPRAEQRTALAGSSPAEPFDVLVVGGGATGCGVALDAATRGLRVGLVEREDFSSGTSSRSTKLIHGGVRYLEKAVFSLDYGQLKLVFHALKERKQLYDVVAGRRLLHLSRYYSVDESVELFPTLARNSNHRSLRGTVVYYDGQMNDSRLNVGLACTASVVGAAILNYAEVVSLIKNETGERIIGARIRDMLTGKEFDAFAKVVVNAAGPFCDSVRKMANNNVVPMICPSSGVHIVLPDYYSPDGMGLIVPKTKDGRVVFMLPWLGRTVAGTTDSNTAITMLPEPHEDEIQFILDAISDYLNVQPLPGYHLGGVYPVTGPTHDNLVSEHLPTPANMLISDNRDGIAAQLAAIISKLEKLDVFEAILDKIILRQDARNKPSIA
ncbi:hypothetical protein GUJ93_ZPchr0015g6775 [Zizania palustris]|uniref:glycerol-3-phosphate dehydrogenase n=1 Tax=Zizania palustris TaxID=103762 RepID=A0A8J5SYT7_ZIZPA|nr:hypothetical protein GUJ93_ZPchr0015g6775 [Zizania palustris]